MSLYPRCKQKTHQCKRCATVYEAKQILELAVFLMDTVFRHVSNCRFLDLLIIALAFDRVNESRNYRFISPV